jgi:hypothetical protein
MKGEVFVEEVLRAVAKETAAKLQVEEINQLVETNENTFQALFFFKKAGIFGVVKCRGKVEIFRSIDSILRFKAELSEQINRKLQQVEQLQHQEPAVVFETATNLCLN